METGPAAERSHPLARLSVRVVSCDETRGLPIPARLHFLVHLAHSSTARTHQISASCAAHSRGRAAPLGLGVPACRTDEAWATKTVTLSKLGGGTSDCGPSAWCTLFNAGFGEKKAARRTSASSAIVRNRAKERKSPSMYPHRTTPVASRVAANEQTRNDSRVSGAVRSQDFCEIKHIIV